MVNAIDVDPAGVTGLLFDDYNDPHSSELVRNREYHSQPRFPSLNVTSETDLEIEAWDLCI